MHTFKISALGMTKADLVKCTKQCSLTSIGLIHTMPRVEWYESLLVENHYSLDCAHDTTVVRSENGLVTSRSDDVYVVVML